MGRWQRDSPEKPASGFMSPHLCWAKSLCFPPFRPIFRLGLACAYQKHVFFHQSPEAENPAAGGGLGAARHPWREGEAGGPGAAWLQPLPGALGQGPTGSETRRVDLVALGRLGRWALASMREPFQSGPAWLCGTGLPVPRPAGRECGGAEPQGDGGRVVIRISSGALPKCSPVTHGAS